MTMMMALTSSTSSSLVTTSKKTMFPQKLWRLVNNPALASAIRWSPDGQSFEVFENQFRKNCLGKENNYFFTNQPKSFVRQLHLYGFRKVTKHQFQHPNFVRDRPDLLNNIRRSYKPIEPRKRVAQGAPIKQNADTQPSTKTTTTTITATSVEHFNESTSFSNSNNNNQLTQLQPLDYETQFNKTTSAPTSGSLVLANGYEEGSANAPSAWYETNHMYDINYNYSYNYNEDYMLTLYSNEIW